MDEKRRGVARDVARLADARHVEAAACGLSLLDEVLGSDDGVVVDALDEGLDLLLHDAEELVDLLLVVCPVLPFSWMGLLTVVLARGAPGWPGGPAGRGAAGNARARTPRALRM